MSNDPERSDASQISTDRESIRAWADEHQAVPFRDREEEAYRLVDEDRAGETHERADWDEFHSHLQENEQVVIYHGETGDEPFEVAHRDEAISRSNVSDAELEERLMEGDTVTSTVTETAVVEEVIVEEATIESELVDTDLVDDSVIDVELLSRDVTHATLEETGAVDADEWFDRDRYLASAGDPTDDEWAEAMGERPMETRDTTETTATSTEPSTTESVTTDDRTEAESGTPVTEPLQSESDTGDRTASDRTYMAVEEEYPYTVHLEVEEAWSVTREVTERYTIESEVTNVEATEADTIEERDIDVEGLQENIIESGMISVDRSPDELREEGAIETEFTEDDSMRTHFNRTRIVEDEVVDRQYVQAEVTAAAERTDFERISSMDVASETTEGTAGGATMTGEGTEERSMGTAGGMESEAEGGEVPLSDDEVGKDVVDASGETIGMVTEVSDDGRTMFVEAHPGITEKIKAALDWGGADEDDYPIEVAQIDHVTRDEVTLKGTEELEELGSPAP